MKLIHQHYDYEYEYDTVQLAELFDLSEFFLGSFLGYELLHSFFIHLHMFAVHKSTIHISISINISVHKSISIYLTRSGVRGPANYSECCAWTWQKWRAFWENQKTWKESWDLSPLVHCCHEFPPIWTWEYVRILRFVRIWMFKNIYIYKTANASTCTCNLPSPPSPTPTSLRQIWQFLSNLLYILTRLAHINVLYITINKSDLWFK